MPRYWFSDFTVTSQENKTKQKEDKQQQQQQKDMQEYQN